MSTALQTMGTGDDAALLERVLADGDIGKLTPSQRVAYYRMRCDAAGLDHRAQPFMYVSLQGKLVLYATKSATQQLAAKHKISTQIVSRETEDGLHVVVVRAVTGDRSTDEIGAVSVKGKQGDDLANCYMKAATKAKRRAVLALCGLGEMDETEVESVGRATVVDVDLDTGEVRTQEQLERKHEPAQKPEARVVEATPAKTETAKPDPRKTAGAAQSATAQGASIRGATGARTAVAGTNQMTPADVVPTGYVVRAPKQAQAAGNPSLDAVKRRLAELRGVVGAAEHARFDGEVSACGQSVKALETLAESVAVWLADRDAQESGQ